MRVLFLDIDGVLNSTDYWQSSVCYESGSLADQLDPRAVENLQRIVDKTMCSIVITSTWKCLYPLDHIKFALQGNGLRSDILGATPDLQDYTISKDADIYSRADEIELWLKEAEMGGIYVDRYVIIDDSRIEYDEESRFGDYFVRINYQHGLTRQIADRIVRLFDQPESRRRNLPTVGQKADRERN